MDIASIKPHTTELELVLPGTSQKIGLTLELQSLASEHCAAVSRRHQEVRRGYLEQGEEVPAAIAEDQAVELYASSIVRWTWADDATWEGEKLALNVANAKKVLGADFILRQVMKVQGDKGRFFANFAGGA